MSGIEGDTEINKSKDTTQGKKKSLLGAKAQM